MSLNAPWREAKSMGSCIVDADGDVVAHTRLGDAELMRAVMALPYLIDALKQIRLTCGDHGDKINYILSAADFALKKAGIA